MRIRRSSRAASNVSAGGSSGVMTRSAFSREVIRYRPGIVHRVRVDADVDGGVGDEAAEAAPFGLWWPYTGRPLVRIHAGEASITRRLRPRLPRHHLPPHLLPSCRVGRETRM